MIPYGRQQITNSDISEVKKVLKSDFLTQGPTVTKFEKTVTDYCNVKYAVAVNSATSALHIACLALELGPGDILWTTPNTFVASANCARYCGAKVDFVDINPVTYNISVDNLIRKLEIAKKKGNLPKILIPVHFAGQPSEMSKIYKLAKLYKFKIIEDASHAIGAKYKKSMIGSCEYSDVTVFSFHPVKIITTGEGGMAVTNDKKIIDKMRRLHIHGITNDKSKMKRRPKSEIWNYQQIDLGFNYRMNDIQAALGISQIRRIDKYVQKRNKIAKIYDLELANLPIKLPTNLSDVYSSYHLYQIRVKQTKKYNQKKIYNYLKKKGIAANLHYTPVHRHPYYENLGFKRFDFPEAERFHKEVISIPIFPSLKKEEQFYVIDTLMKAFKK